MKVILFYILLFCGIAGIAIGLLMPAHLRAQDPYVIQRHGSEGPSLTVAAGEAAANNPAVAKGLLAAAEKLGMTNTTTVIEQLREAAGERTPARTVLEKLEEVEAGRIQVAETPVFAALKKNANRQVLTNSLQSIEATQVLRIREAGRTNWAVFAPVKSAAGLPLDVSILTTAFLMEQRAFGPNSQLRDEILKMSAPGPFPGREEFFLSIFALAKRFSSEQIIAFVGNIPTAAALQGITSYMQEHPDATPVLYTATILSKDGGALAAYLNRFYRDAEKDIGFALASGPEALKWLLARQQPVYRCSVYNKAAESRFVQFIFRPLVNLATNSPALALVLKFCLIGVGGFLVAYSLKFRPNAPEERNFVLYSRFSLARRMAFTCVLLLLTIVLGEPYLAQGEQRPPRANVHFPILAAVAKAAANTSKKPSSPPMIDQHTILAIGTFLCLQAVIYSICLVKLAEIRKQPVSNEIKLKLLENEDHLFDGGLYCGLFGTAASLILLTLGAIKPSLVSAYSSTLFGILFVALLKIGHVRPLKRRLLLDIANKPAVI